MRILFIGDNKDLLSLRLHNIRSVVKKKGLTEKHQITFGDSDEIDFRQSCDSLIDTFDLIFSIHCKQIFPKRLVENVRCINLHPGYNPYNRGMFPHVFSIINRLPAGATLHEMDEKIDHGPIIVREKIEIWPEDTSTVVYEKVIKLEIKLFRENIESILDKTYTTMEPEEQGNVNSLADFEKLCKIDLEEEGTFGEFIDRLKALTHDGHDNAYFLDEAGERVYVGVNLWRR